MKSMFHRGLLTFFGLLLLSLTGYAQQVFSKQEPFAHTYSIVARDPKTGDMAVAVQSHWFSVGTAVSWAEAGVGAVATQSFTNKSFGMRGLALLKSGKTAQQALDELLATDEGRDVRQVAIVDNKGNVAAHTGKKCVDMAGHITGKQFSVQANMMLSDKVWPAMAKAFEQSEGQPLAERMLAALDAAQAQGGDIRGRQSAALLVVRGQASQTPWDDRLVDLRVDDNPEPLKELRRLLKMQRAYDHMNAGDLAVEKNDMPTAVREYQTAEQAFPQNLEMRYWHAITLANKGQVAEAKKMLQPIFKQDANWRTLTERLPKVGLLTVSAAELQQILSLK
ncbi:Zn-dependent protease [Solirubrum puertoriconensis]|uniref:Zn-dependent protease n=2 Tax=Solirubrum puertoriconensis TaxID=1751427 RepID=A0A9X0HL39_SOLP1|nr:Zn-dependent protease [Solirubrum puertoriconensis]